ncbi:reverse transcriptase domain, reverse transcriptase zinc-binding domain protein [Tanacetum coccineum]
MNSFAAVLQDQPLKKVVKIKEMRSEENVEGAAVTLPFEAFEAVNARFINTLVGYFIGERLAYPLVENYVKNSWAKYGLKRVQMHEEFFLFQFKTREGMESVLENGPWLIRRVPLILNEWTPNTILKKDEIKCAPVWVKLHHVPIVAYSEIGLSLITSQIGKPLMLDSYTSNMCLHSWGRSSYARALIEISSLTELKKSLVIAIPLANKKGHTFATIDVEYEWTPPRCNTCRIFDHVSEKCPKLPKETTTPKASEEGYTEVKRKKNKKHPAKKQVEGIRLSKPNLNLQYRRVEPKTINAKTDGEKDGNQHIQSEVNLSSVGTATTSKQVTNGLKLKNSYSSLNGNESDWDIDDTKLSVVNESDSEDMDEEMVMEEPIVHKNDLSTGASTPDVKFS